LQFRKPPSAINHPELDPLGENESLHHPLRIASLLRLLLTLSHVLVTWKDIQCIGHLIPSQCRFKDSHGQCARENAIQGALEVSVEEVHLMIPGMVEGTRADSTGVGIACQLATDTIPINEYLYWTYSTSVGNAGCKEPRDGSKEEFQSMWLQRTKIRSIPRDQRSPVGKTCEGIKQVSNTQ
jgi:hypothetical protein